MINLDYIEKKQNIILPEEYKHLYQSNYKEFSKCVKIQVKDEDFGICRFLSATEINDILLEFYDFWGYDIVPIVETKYKDYICLYYKESRQNPSIVYWNYELALESSAEGITFLYDSMHKFITDISNR